MNERASKILPLIEALSQGPVGDHIRIGSYRRDGLHESFEMDFPHGSRLQVSFDGKEQCGVLCYRDSGGNPAGPAASEVFDRVYSEFGKVRLWLDDSDAVALATNYVERLYEQLAQIK